MSRKRYGRFFIGLSILAFALTGCGTTASAPASRPAKTQAKPTVSAPVGASEQWKKPPKMTINPQKYYAAIIDTTAGSFEIALFSHKDPVAANNFIFLAQHKFYNNDEIFRVIKPFMFQTGSPENEPEGGPGYQWNGELPVPYPYAPGIVAMANTGNPNTNGSQFFVCTGPESQSLNKSAIYTELGKVISGCATVQKIAAGTIKTNPLTGEDSLPIHPYYIEHIQIQSAAQPFATSQESGSN
ncbi:MAG: peptidylprolyl isomerase [Firmicutes bacterium]|nr:peptidylprolyl isomerase [Bacillota bacterium]